MLRSAQGVECGAGGGGRCSLAATTTVSLPVPTSTNQLYIYRGKFRTISPKYRAWKRAAGEAMSRQFFDPIAGDVDIRIRVPRDNRRDIDNYCKALLDCLVEHGVIASDRNVQFLEIEKLPMDDKSTVHIEVRPAQ